MKDHKINTYISYATESWRHDTAWEIKLDDKKLYLVAKTLYSLATKSLVLFFSKGVALRGKNFLAFLSCDVGVALLVEE